MLYRLDRVLRRKDRQLPLSLAGFLLVVLAAFGALAWREVRLTALSAAEERLAAAALRFSDLLTRSSAARGGEVGPLAPPRPAFVVRDRGAGHDMAYPSGSFGVFQRRQPASEFPDAAATCHFTLPRQP